MGIPYPYPTPHPPLSSPITRSQPAKRLGTDRREPAELAEGARALLRAGASVRAGVLEPEAGVHAQGQHGYVFDPRDWDSGGGIGRR